MPGEFEEKLSELVEDAIDHGIRAFTDGLRASMIGRTVVDMTGEVYSSDGAWDVLITFDDGSVIRSLKTRAEGPVGEIVSMAGGNVYGDDQDEKDFHEWAQEGDTPTDW